MDVAFFDLDSTIADTRQRHHLIDTEDRASTDWTAYSMAAAEDAPMVGTVALLRLLHRKGVCVHIVTGRDAAAREITIRWLAEHDIPWDYLTMREPGDDPSNGGMKRRKIEAWLAAFPDANPVVMLEDWPPVADDLDGLVPVLLVTPRHRFDPPAAEQGDVDAEAAYA